MGELCGKPKLLKIVNNDLIKNTLKVIGSATKAELARETGISLTTVGLILTNLVETGEVVSCGTDQSSGGRRAERYTLNLNHALAVVLCIDALYIDYALGNAAGEILEDGRIDVDSREHMKCVEMFLDNIISKNPSIKAIGLGIPGAVDNGTPFTGSKIRSWHNYNVQAHLEQRYNVPVVLENDLNAIATGFSFNRMNEAGLIDSSAWNMVYIQVNTSGTGAGIIVNGKLVRGFSHFAGELGFLRLEKQKILDDIVNENANEDEYADSIARAITALSCIVNPEYIVIGGEDFRFETLHRINEYCSEYMAENIKPEIIPAEDGRMDYISGLMYLTVEMMNSRIRLVNTGR